MTSWWWIVSGITQRSRSTWFLIAALYPIAMKDVRLVSLREQGDALPVIA
jgi:hypothetical protein